MEEKILLTGFSWWCLLGLLGVTGIECWKSCSVKMHLNFLLQIAIFFAIATQRHQLEKGTLRGNISDIFLLFYSRIAKKYLSVLHWFLSWCLTLTRVYTKIGYIFFEIPALLFINLVLSSKWVHKWLMKKNEIALEMVSLWLKCANYSLFYLK